MPVIETIQRLGQNILDLVFPVACLSCGTEGTYLCGACRTKLTRLPNQICVVCYKPTPYGKTHPGCVTRHTVDGAVAGLSYKDPKVQKIIEAFKYNFVSNLSVPLSNIIVEAMDRQGLSDYFKKFTIVPVPLHKRRFNWRGFNQSELLSKALSEKLQIPIESALITRQKFTEPQTQLSQQERKKNLSNAFVLSQDVTRKQILLVDDLVTSGATANELAKVFKQHHAAEVWVISAAHG